MTSGGGGVRELLEGVVEGRRFQKVFQVLLGACIQQVHLAQDTEGGSLGWGVVGVSVVASWIGCCQEMGVLIKWVISALPPPSKPHFYHTPTPFLSHPHLHHTPTPTRHLNVDDGGQSTHGSGDELERVGEEL